MIRETVPFLVLLAVAGPAMAQQPAPDLSHTVVSGETLGAIAREYYGSASEWLRVFEANRDLLSDPDVVPVGVTLVIPDAGADGATPAQVTGVELRGTPAAQQDLLSYRSRRQLLEGRPFQPTAVPELPEAELVAIDRHDWNNDPHSLGAWLAPPLEGEAGLDHENWMPAGRLAFASSDIASENAGWFDGAVVSGEEAAAALARVLGRN